MAIDCPLCGEMHPEDGECYKCSFPGDWLPLIDLCEELIYGGEKAREALFWAVGHDDLAKRNDAEARKYLRAAAGMCADFSDVTGVEELPHVAAERAERIAMFRARRKRKYGGVIPGQPIGEADNACPNCGSNDTTRYTDGNYGCAQCFVLPATTPAEGE